jgi:hypothetical protein
MNWTKSDNFISALVDLPVEGGMLTEAEKDRVIEAVRECKLNHFDFVELDEKPGRFGYEYTSRKSGVRGGWHWKLRQVRNTRSDLFEALAEDDGEERDEYE